MRCAEEICLLFTLNDIWIASLWVFFCNSMLVVCQKFSGVFFLCSTMNQWRWMRLLNRLLTRLRCLYKFEDHDAEFDLLEAALSEELLSLSVMALFSSANLSNRTSFWPVLPGSFTWFYWVNTRFLPEELGKKWNRIKKVIGWMIACERQTAVCSSSHCGLKLDQTMLPMVNIWNYLWYRM